MLVATLIYMVGIKLAVCHVIELVSDNDRAHANVAVAVTSKFPI